MTSGCRDGAERVPRGCREGAERVPRGCREVAESVTIKAASTPYSVQSALLPYRSSLEGGPFGCWASHHPGDKKYEE